MFDALCGRFSANAPVVLRYDDSRQIRLASMRGTVGAACCRRSGINPASPETLIEAAGDRALRDRDAVLAIWSDFNRLCRGLRYGGYR